MAAVYITLQEALEEAGLHHVQLGDAALGTVDGSNKAFSLDHKPLVDWNYDDEVTIDDMKVYVDGVPVVASEVDARFGTFELTKAPDAGAAVTVDYVYSPVPLEYVKKLRAEATAWINNQMEQVDPCAPYGKYNRPIPGTVTELCRNYVAARLLIREYGYNQDIEGTSKDGYKRLEQVKADLMEYMKSGGECGDSGDDDAGVSGVGGVSSSSDGDLFGRFDGGRYCGDDCFERGL